MSKLSAEGLHSSLFCTFRIYKTQHSATPAATSMASGEREGSPTKSFRSLTYAMSSEKVMGSHREESSKFCYIHCAISSSILPKAFVTFATAVLKSPPCPASGKTAGCSVTPITALFQKFMVCSTSQLVPSCHYFAQKAIPGLHHHLEPNVFASLGHQ